MQRPRARLCRGPIAVLAALALSPVVRRQPARRRHALLVEGYVLGWDGIQLDLESLRRHDGPGLVKLVRRLRADLPDGVAISMAAMAERSRAAYGRHGYRLGGLGAFDRFVLMAFDQHGPGRSGPGPVGALQWARRTAKPLVATWHPRAGEWSARVAKGTVWWSDHRSYVRRVALADDLGVHGVAVWQLGSADPLS